LELEHVSFVNDALRQYDALTEYVNGHNLSMVDSANFFDSYFGALVHIDAVDTLFVYEWRLEQERALRKARGTGMKDKQVIEFVNGCECPRTDDYFETPFADWKIYRLSSL